MTDFQSSLEAERSLVRKYHKLTYDIKTWLVEEVRPVANEPSSSPQRASISSDARAKGRKAHVKWDEYVSQVNDLAVREAMAQVDFSLLAALREVGEGNLTPNVDNLRDALKSLREKANEKLDAQL